MVRLMKYFLSAIVLVTLFYQCDRMPLEYTLQYSYTSEELDSLESRISTEVRYMYEGSLLRQTKWDTLIAINPENEEYHRRKSFAHSRIGDYHLAFPLIEKAVKLDPFNGLYFTGWQLLYMYRDYDRAIESFSYYDDISTGVDYIWGENINYLKGLAFKQKGLYDQAVEEFNKCILYEGENITEYAFVYRGIANLRNECTASAIIDFDEALNKYSRCTMALVYKGEALIYEQDYQRAKECLEKARVLLEKGSKKTHPYVEVFDEVHLQQVDDLLMLIPSDLPRVES